MGVLELLTSELVWLKSWLCINAAEESAVWIIMRHLLYLSILTDHDAVVAKMVTAVVMVVGYVRPKDIVGNITSVS